MYAIRSYYVEKLLAANDKSNEKQLLQYVNRNAQKLKNLLNQLLDLSKLDADKLELNLENYNLNEIVDGCYKLFQPFAIQKKIVFTISNPQEKLYAKVDNVITSYSIHYTKLYDIGLGRKVLFILSGIYGSKWYARR